VSETTSGFASHVFPPALVSELRKRFGSDHDEVPAVDDDTLVELLTTIFFAGLETYEGEHNAIRVAFLGRSPVAFVMPEQERFETASFYQWKMMPFESPRPFDIPELVKLAVAGAHAQISIRPSICSATTTATGLAREGLAADVDPVLKVTASRPGCLSIRNGRTLLIGYERGAVLWRRAPCVLGGTGPARARATARRGPERRRCV
jgi:hypothetical protein